MAADAPVVATPPTETSPEAVATAQAMLGAPLVTLYESLPARTAVVIFTGHLDPCRMASLNACKVAFESAIKSENKAEEMDRTEWRTASDRRALVEKAKRGLLSLGIKYTCVYGSSTLIRWCPRSGCDLLGRAMHWNMLVRLATLTLGLNPNPNTTPPRGMVMNEPLKCLLHPEEQLSNAGDVWRAY